MLWCNICEAGSPIAIALNYFLLVLNKVSAFIVSCFFLFSRVRPLASSLVSGFDLGLALGNCLGLGLVLGLTTKGLNF